MVHCYPASSPNGLLGTLGLNIITSLYVLFVPIPILWMANIKWWKKLGLVLLISGNGFVIAVACLRVFFLLTCRRNDPEQAGRWALHVCFVAVVTINLPLFFPLINRWITTMVAVQPTFRRLRTISVWEQTPSSTEPKSYKRRRVDSGVGLEMGFKTDSGANARDVSVEGVLEHSSRG
ncbi:hypothetical protein F4820DRAFT_470104 [Hypoxylon rubiginosum]|uniref:Uncharacterized protein n=1 Tax=Hypoxylon rubiginosum TaxID=110542 RepID=A0ACB9ZFG2_9PEZI|nr:hypothetical protein F4820DRAFT_470104 [Hypoxylon rubiginosum]